MFLCATPGLGPELALLSLSCATPGLGPSRLALFYCASAPSRMAQVTPPSVLALRVKGVAQQLSVGLLLLPCLVLPVGLLAKLVELACSCCL